MKAAPTALMVLGAGLFLGVGFLLGVLWSPQDNGVPVTPWEEPRPPAEAVSRSEIQTLRSELALLRSENRQLRQDLSRAREAPADAIAAAEEDAAEEAEPPLDPAAIALARRIQERRESRHEARVDDLELLLNLSEDQQAAVRALLARRTGPGGWGMRGERFDMDEAMQAILSEAQFETYLEHSQETIHRHADAAASAGVGRIADALALSQQQQNVAFETLHILTQEALIARETGEDFPYTELLRERFTEFLTAEQIEQAAEMGFFARPRRGGGGFRGLAPSSP